MPLSRLLSLYVEATQRLFRAQQRFLGTEDAKMPYIIGVAGSVAAGKSTALACCRRCWPAGRGAQGRPGDDRRFSVSECGAGARRPDGQEGLSGKL